jgi:hypothetical protein
MKKLFRAIALATGFVAAGAGTVSAAQPNNQACLGHDVSGYALAGNGLRWLPGIVQANTPFGQAIQAHLAGLLPDEVQPNSCND